jgi:hypothetical protein
MHGERGVVWTLGNKVIEVVLADITLVKGGQGRGSMTRGGGGGVGLKTLKNFTFLLPGASPLIRQGGGGVLHGNKNRWLLAIPQSQ